MIMKLSLIPIQDDHENGMNRAGFLRLNANTHVEQRGTETGTDQRFLEGYRRNQLCRGKEKGGLHLGREGVDVPGVSATGQEAAGNDPGLRGEGDRAEQRAGDPADPAVPENGERGGESLSAAGVYADLHRSGPGGDEWLSGPATRRILEREY